VEAPLIIERHFRNDGFIAIVVAAGGLDYTEVDSVLGSQVGPAYMPAWNICKVIENPIGDMSTAKIANLMLDHRVTAIGKQLGPGEPLGLALSTRSPIMKKPGFPLAADLTHRFDGRLAKPGAWVRHVLPGMRSIRETLQRRAADRPIHCSGQLCLPAAVALGTEFLSVSGLHAIWMQDLTTFGGNQEVWGLDIIPGTTKFVAQSIPANVNATDLALVVSVTHNIMADVCSCFTKDFPFRAMVHVHDEPAKSGTHHQLSAAEAVQLAHLAVNRLREAWKTYKVRGTVHLFVAGPAGLAFLIGQLLNGFGNVQTYEHIPICQPCYLPAALLQPSM